MAGDSRARVERTLRCSIADGIGYSVMVGAGETYFIPFAIFLDAPNLLLGLLVAFPIFLGSLSQVFSEKLLALLGTRKRLISSAVLLQGLTFLPILLVPLVPAHQDALLLAAVSAYWVFGLVLGPSWSSLMGDLVEDDRRGRYFGVRNRYIQISNFASLVAAGLVLYYFKLAGREYAGYVVIFSLAALARLVSFVFLLLHWEPPMASPPHPRTFSMVAETLRDRNHRLLILYLSCMNLGVYLSAPFFSTYMLRPPAPLDHGLGWSYVTYTAVNGIAMVFKFLFLPLWGRASDRFGTRKCLTLSAALIASLPLFWLTPREHPALYLTVVCLTQALGGFAWAGHELCSFNFLLDAACARDRPRLVASMNIVNGLMIFLGSSAGALLVSAFSAWGAGNPFLAVFLASALTRALVCLTFLPRLREVRRVESISYRSLLFRVTGVRVGVGPVMRFFLLPLKQPPSAVPVTAPARMAPVGETEVEESLAR